MARRERDAAATRLDAFRRVRQGLAGNYRRLLALSGQPGWAALAAHHEPLQAGLAALEADTFQVVVIGEFKTGKSTFLNALLGRQLCPVKVTPETAKVSRIHHRPGGPDAFQVTGEGLSQEERPLRSGLDLHDFVGEGGRFTAQVRELDLHIDGRGTPLACGAVLVDTPGLRSVYESHDQVTQAYAEKADAVIFFFDALRPVTADDLRFLKAHPAIARGAGTLYVLNRIDQVTEGAAGVAAAEAHVREQLSEIGVALEEEGWRLPRLFPVSAKLALADGEAPGAAALAASRFEPLRRFLGRALADGKGIIAVEGALAKQVAALRGALLALDEERRRAEAAALGKAGEGADPRGTQQALRATQAAAEQLLLDLREEVRAVRRFHRQAVERFIETLKQEAQEAVYDADDAGALRRRLPGLITTSCQAWTKRHEAALRERLGAVQRRQAASLRRHQITLRQGARALEVSAGALDAGDFDGGEGLGAAAGMGLAGATIGFAVAGPVGAAVASALGAAVAGLLRLFGSDWRDDAWEAVEASIDADVAPGLEESGASYLTKVQGRWSRQIRARLEGAATALEQEVKRSRQAARRRREVLEAALAALAERRRALRPMAPALRLAASFVAEVRGARAPAVVEAERHATALVKEAPASAAWSATPRTPATPKVRRRTAAPSRRPPRRAPTGRPAGAPRARLRRVGKK